MSTWLDEYLDVEMAERHEVVNLNNPARSTAAIRLVRTHETARRAPEVGDGTTTNPVPLCQFGLAPGPLVGLTPGKSISLGIFSE